jgi:antitoxin VapB
LPKQYQFDADEVCIRRQGHAVILEPITRDWMWLDHITGSVDPDFVEATNEEPGEQERSALGHFK